MEHLRFGDTLVVDDGSDGTSLLDYLAQLEARGLAVIRNQRNGKNAFHGGLYGCMNQALDFAIDGGYEYIHFIQDDMQFMWHDPNILEKVELIFNELEDAVQVGVFFHKKILINTPERLQSLENQCCYHLKPYGMSDLGFVRLSLINKHGFRFGQSENETSAYWRQRGYRFYLLGSPVLAWIPWPTIFSSGKQDGSLKPPPHKYYLKPLDLSQIRRLNNRPLEEVPYHEDYCVPWGWACLRPYWFTTFSDEYIRWIWLSFRQGRPLMPWWVYAGKPAYFVLPRIWLLSKRVSDVLRMLVRRTRAGKS